MSRISTDAMAKALTAARAMDLQQKEQLADDVFRAQPNLLGSVVALPQLGVALSKVDLAVESLFVCFLAMKESGLTWPVITEDAVVGSTTGIREKRHPKLKRQFCGSDERHHVAGRVSSSWSPVDSPARPGQDEAFNVAGNRRKGP